jgi:glyoxylase I family protein
MSCCVGRSAGRPAEPGLLGVRTGKDILGRQSIVSARWKEGYVNIQGMAHVNVNCSDFDRSRAFYERLGFEVVWEVEPVGSPAISAAVGMPPYRVKGAVMALGGNPRSTAIDLLEWQDPEDGEAPYPHLYHLGLARVALFTSDMDADVQQLREAGVEFVSEPVSLAGPTGETVRFVCFKDPDGTVLELVSAG